MMPWRRARYADSISFRELIGFYLVRWRTRRVMRKRK
jgi:hypothetical protein